MLFLSGNEDADVPVVEPSLSGCLSGFCMDQMGAGTTMAWMPRKRLGSL